MHDDASIDMLIVSYISNHQGFFLLGDDASYLTIARNLNHAMFYIGVHRFTQQAIWRFEHPVSQFEFSWDHLLTSIPF